jgi:hypothetical protein
MEPSATDQLGMIPALAGTVTSAGKDLLLAPGEEPAAANPDGSRFAGPLCLSALALAFRIIRAETTAGNLALPNSIQLLADEVIE